MDYILAIDLGTSGPKASLFTVDARLVASEFERASIYLEQGGGAEQDPDEWWTAIMRATRRLIERAQVDVARIAAIGVTAQWGGMVAVDASGIALGRAIIWADSRGAPHVAAITGGWPRVEGYGVDKVWAWLRRTGGIPTRGGKDPIAHLLFLKEERPALYARAAFFLDIKDYLNLRLTGLVASSPDTVTLFWVTDNRRIEKIDYDDTLLRMSGIERRTLPDLRPSTSILGPLSRNAAQDLGLPEGIPVAVGSADIVAAAVGSGAVLEGQAHVHIGTSSWLSCHLPWKKTDLFHNMATLPSAMPGLYLLVNEQDVAGGALAWLRHNVIFPVDGLEVADPDDAYERLVSLAATVPAGSGGVIFTPWLNGERSPVEDLTIRAGFHNLSLRTTRAEMVRAVLEGVALNTRWLAPYVERMAKRPIGPIRIVGGGAQSELWCQIYADVLERPILQVEEPQQASARGAALLAAVAIGGLRVEQIPQAVQVRATYTPAAGAAETYAPLFKTFTQIYKQNRALYRGLNG